MRFLFPTANPILQPAIAYVLDIDVNSTQIFLEFLTCKIDGGGLSPK